MRGNFQIRSSCTLCRAGALALLGTLLASAQITPSPYPGGEPPGGPRSYPGRYPEGQSPGIPQIWKKKKKDKGQDTAQETYLNYTGIVQKRDDTTLVIGLPDSRLIDFKITSKTKYFESDKEAKATVFAPGDAISIQATQDDQGFLTAVNVRLTKHNAAPPPPGPRDEPDSEGKDTKDESPSPAVAEAHDHSPTGDVAGFEEGPPTLRRGAPPKQKVTPLPPAADPAEAPKETASNAKPAMVVTVDESGRTEQGTIAGYAASGGDKVIMKAQEVAATFIEALPNYVCKEFMARYVSRSPRSGWDAIDVVSTELVYENGRENYRNVAINGKPFNKKMEELNGSWSTGEFGTVLRGLLAPGMASFHYVKNDTIVSRPAKVYDFAVPKEHSNWSIHAASQLYMPAYKGSIWIDNETARVLRIEMQAVGLPKDFPLDTVESTVDYDFVHLETRQFLLPVRSENLSCQRGTTICGREVIDFRNYHKFEGESVIKFEDAKK